MGNPIFLINFAEKSNDRYMTRLWILATAVLFSTVQPAAAQTAEKPRGVAGLFSKLGSLLDTMAVKGVDRNYIEAPKHPWQVILKGNINQSVLKLDSKVDASSMFTDVVSDLFSACITTAFLFWFHPYLGIIVLVTEILAVLLAQPRVRLSLDDWLNDS